MNLNEFFNELSNNSSRNFKIDTLKQAANNTLLKRVIQLALDPFTQFYIRKIPAYTPAAQTNLSHDVLDKLDGLSNRTYTGHAGIDYLREILTSLNSDDAKVIERIIAKDLKCGVSVATANAVWKDLITEYPCMLCSQVDDKSLSKIKFPAYVQLKMDGMRFNAICKNNSVEFRTRNGRLLNLAGTPLENDFINMSRGQDIVFDGELLVTNHDRKTGNGILNKALKGTITLVEMNSIIATVWDVLPYHDFIRGVCKTPYVDRFNQLHKLYTDYNTISIVNTHKVDNIAAAYQLFNLYLAENQEGIILKDFNNIWENKRSKTLLKFKGEYECDLRIVDVIDGNGAFKNMVGAFLCKTDDDVLVVSVGSGLSEQQRKYYMENKPINKIVAVKYNAIIDNKSATDKKSLFLPIFIEVREDKTVADLIKDLK